jgi:hypothetical protein
MNLSLVIVKKIRQFGPQQGHVKMTFSLFFERISKKYESFECFFYPV